MAFVHSRRRWFGTCPCRPVPRGLPSSVKQLRTTQPFGLSHSWHTVVCEASDGADAVRKVVEHRPDVVLLDITMPVMNGLEAARRIKHEFPLTLILVVSQYDSAPFAREAIAAGANGYIAKSNASAELIPMLRRTVSKHMRT